jgi:hypothetical protein
MVPTLTIQIYVPSYVPLVVTGLPSHLHGARQSLRINDSGAWGESLLASPSHRLTAVSMLYEYMLLVDVEMHTCLPRISISHFPA